MTCSNADMVQFLLDNGAEMPDNILEEAVDASKATVKVLIDNGANTDLKFDVLQPTDGGGRRLEGDFDLKDYFKHWGREDLIDLLE